MTDDDDWAIQPEDREKYGNIFDSLGPENGKLSGEKAKPVLINSGLPTNVLGKIWELSDIDRDGQLDRVEMTVALHLVYCALKNDPTPNALPHSLVPPSKRGQLGAVGRRTSLPIGAFPVLPGPPAALSAAHRPRTGSMTSLEGAGLGGSGQQPFSTAAAFGQQQHQASTSVGGSRSLSGTPTPQVRPPALWIVDKQRWEPVFIDADRDRDGLVNGADVKHLFLQSGLTQNYLAHIWSLCDIKQTGMLTVEQFALAMHLIEQKRAYGVEPPSTLPPDLVPPSFRPSPAGMTDMGAQVGESNDLLGGLLGVYAAAGPTLQPTGNKEIDAVTKELEQMQAEKRQLDVNVHQLETDLTVKQSEIKNLEVELNTLDATVKQIERQKGEAQRRLDELDAQRMALQQELSDLRTKFDLDLREVDTLGKQIDHSTASLKEQEEELNNRRQALQSLRDEESKLEVRVQMGRSSMQQASQQSALVEQQAKQIAYNVEQIKAHTSALAAKLGEMEAFVQSEDRSAVDETLLARMPPMNLMPQRGGASFSSLGSPLPTSGVVSGPARGGPLVANAVRNFQQREVNPNSFVAQDGFAESFKSGDAFASNGFGGGDPFAGHDPFKDGSVGAFAEDPFKAHDPFASSTSSSTGFGASFSDPFSASNNDPFSGKNLAPSGFESKGPPARPPPPGSGSAGKKPPPGRPAPPRSRPMTPRTPEPLDPWGGATTPSTAEGGAAFANFADFSQFS